MAQEISETSVASSSPTPNCWEIHAPLSSWNYSHINRWQPHSHHSTSSSCDEDNSISNTTSLMDSSSADLSGDPPDNNLWSQVLLNVGGGVEMHHHQNHHEDGENFLEVLSSKSLPTEIFDPACDYLKKMDSSWEINNFNGGLMEHERFTNLSDLVKNWSLAPPAHSQFDHVQIAPNSLACNVPINPMTNSHIKHHELLPNNGVLSSNYLPYMHEIKMENQHQDHINGYQYGLNNSITGFDNKFHSPISADVSWSSTSSRSLSDLISFKPVQFRTSKQVLKGSDHSSHDTKNSSSTRGSGRSTGTTNEGKKKRSEDNNSEALLKKSKLENSSSSSSVKLQVPKVKFADRISALQQIVSPFGKTDTASVLMEAINYIRCLQEQVQLLSDPYMKLNANMEQNSWGGMERKEKDKVDLKTRGLCLVPISCTPQAYRENSGPDYWTPTYRGCLYR